MSDDLSAGRPVSDDGTLLRLAKTPSGGERTEVWRDGAWRSSSSFISDLFDSPGLPPRSSCRRRAPASPRLLS